MECWKTECSSCGEKVHADKCPQVGCFDGEKYRNSLCKKCWLRMTKPNPDQERRNFYIVFRNGLRIDGLTFNESWEEFTKVLGTDNPCCVYRDHSEMRVDR